jgi:1-deoxy-D-xylulose-5-phosphate reductoisomerase
MGPKITIDSATMMNKALEIIEARWLFGLPADQIDVLIHPESIVHSMVEYQDGSVIAQLGTPDMKTPIQYALTYPRRVPGIADPLDWGAARTLHFEPPDFERFPALRLGYAAARQGGTTGAVLNAANEAAVERFRAGELSFGRIVETTTSVFERHENCVRPTLDTLLAADAWARAEVMRC